MPFALVTIGLLFIVTGFQNTYKQFFTQVESDFSGPQSFIYWLIAFGFVGSLGYIPELKSFSRASMALILIAMFLADKGGVFAKFNLAVAQGSSTPVNSPGEALPAAGGSSGGSTGDGGSGILGDIGAIADIASFF